MLKMKGKARINEMYLAGSEDFPSEENWTKHI
jgi:hypothetical protein